MSSNKKDCLTWLLRNYGNPKHIETQEYKEYETECATKDNIKDIENLHLYFNDSNLIRSIYKQMSIDYGFCFLKEIEISGTTDDIKFKIYSSKTNKLNDFTKQQYIYSEILPCQNPTFAIPFSVSQHANMLIINREKKTVEHFEPNGEFIGEIGDLLTVAAEKLIKELFPSYTYIPVISFCPETGIQMELARRFPASKFTGSCAIWSMWYAFLRLSSPNLDQKVIYEYSIQTEDLDNLNDFVIYLINAFISKVNIIRNEEGQPMSVDGKQMKVFKKITYDNGDIYEGQTIFYNTGEKEIFIPFGRGTLFVSVLNETYEGSFVMGDIIEGTLTDNETGEIIFKGKWSDGNPILPTSKSKSKTKRRKIKGGVSKKRMNTYLKKITKKNKKI